MIILGHPDIPYEPLYYIESIEEIAMTPANATLWLGPYAETKEVAKHCFENEIPYAVMAASLTEALLANALHAKYILADASLAPQIQKTAETYLFDAKILLPVSEEKEMESAARDGIDGVIFQGAIELPAS
ncbi:hypothetical protein [Hydrogenimonas urashimensis]|uniref:hypothetical protein n=1 Tax=Hydrogenimonas urashimensis TaxID=2740515 RepID=UPI001915F786|nr:hypothetical protein [Hydrogenimonas urashimensis]